MWAASAALSFLTSPVGRVAALGIALFVWTAYQRMDATADCKSEQLQLELAAANKALEDAMEISEAAELRAVEAETEIAELERSKEELLDDLSKEGPQCVLPDDVRERLLRIR